MRQQRLRTMGAKEQTHMPPDDSTPLGDAMTHRFSQQKIPEPKAGSVEAREREQATDISRRPALPDPPKRPTAADLVDDEEGSTERAIPDRGKPPTKQRG